MRVRKAATIIALLVAFLAGVAALVLAPDRPVTLKLEHVLAAGSINYSATGPKHLLIFDVAVQYQGLAGTNWLLYGAAAEARVTNRWVQAQAVGLSKDERGHFSLIVPPEADRCRLHIRYARVPLNWRLWNELARRGLWKKFKTLGARWAPDFKKPPKAKQVSIELAMPRVPEAS